MFQYIIALGSNLGNKKKNLLRAINILKGHVLILETSKILVTPPYLDKEQDFFFNQGLFIETDYYPLNLLLLLENIENLLGKHKIKKYGARLIDLDIVWYSEGTFCSKKLRIPHEYNLKRYWVRSYLFRWLKDKKDPYYEVLYNWYRYSYHYKKILRNQNLIVLSITGLAFLSKINYSSIDALYLRERENLSLLQCCKIFNKFLDFFKILSISNDELENLSFLLKLVKTYQIHAISISQKLFKKHITFFLSFPTFIMLEEEYLLKRQYNEYMDDERVYHVKKLFGIKKIYSYLNKNKSIQKNFLYTLEKLIFHYRGES